jgi:hypothetical protein
MASGSSLASSPTVAVATKEVLACFGEHKRVLKFRGSSESPAQEVSCLKQAFLTTFSDLLPESGVEEKNLTVQLKNEVWHGQFLDVTDGQPISDRI